MFSAFHGSTDPPSVADENEYLPQHNFAVFVTNIKWKGKQKSFSYCLQCESSVTLPVCFPQGPPGFPGPQGPSGSPVSKGSCSFGCSLFIPYWPSFSYFFFYKSLFPVKRYVLHFEMEYFSRQSILSLSPLLYLSLPLTLSLSLPLYLNLSLSIMKDILDEETIPLSFSSCSIIPPVYVIESGTSVVYNPHTHTFLGHTYTISHTRAHTQTNTHLHVQKHNFTFTHTIHTHKHTIKHLYTHT
jgi:hypothetical protein